MRIIKRLIAVLLTACMLLGGASLAEAANTEAPAQTEGFTTYAHGDRVTLIDGACTDAPIHSFDDAYAVVGDVLDQLGGDEDTHLAAWRELDDAFGNHYYVFQQMYNDTTVLGGAVKVIADAEGRMLGLTSSIEANPQEEAVGESIAADKAERIVLDTALATRQQALTVLEGRTERMILPLALEINLEEDEEGSRYVWVVYTDNPDSGENRAHDLPYLAHYVTLTGEYLYSLPTIMPGDEAGASGFDASYVFEFMEPVNYTGYVDLSSGEEMEISVDVMRDRRTGMYYLGNLERRIVVADCWEFLYGGNRVVLASSPNNLEWDQVALTTLYNYCRAYDYYKEIGWIGGDGLGTPMLVLNDYCDINHVPVDNAAYAGGYLGWQVFLASQCNDFSQCLDVLCHEFTHCVTGSVMTYNAYKNDFGAINEAMSDIQGKTCQMMTEGRENVTWELGDRSVVKIRSMDEPHRHQQPEFTWDVYYMPNVKTPTVLNDQGGVHSNSSLLNNLAYRLYVKGGMTLEEGRAFWFTVDCAMVPGTDYAQLSEILPWALKITGLERYDGELRRALDATRLGVEDIPDTFDGDRALLTLNLPENEAFDDEQWIMMVFVVNVEKLVDSVKDIATNVLAGNHDVLPRFLRDLLDGKPEEGAEKEEGLLESFVNDVLKDDDVPADKALGFAERIVKLLDNMDDVKKDLADWARERFDGVFYNATTNAGQDGRTMRIVSVPGHAVPVLLHGVINEKTSDLEDVDALVYLAGKWIDVGGLAEMADALEAQGGDTAELSDEMEAYLDRLLGEKGTPNSLEDFLDILFYRVEGGRQDELPTGGLDTVKPKPIDLNLAEAQQDVPAPEPRMSRPKLAKAEEEDEVSEAEETDKAA